MKRLTILGGLVAALALVGCERPGEFDDYDSGSSPATNTIMTPSDDTTIPPASDLNRNVPPAGSQTPPPPVQPQPETQPDLRPQQQPTPDQQPDRDLRPQQSTP